MDLKEIKKIIELMEEKNLSEFEWEEEGVRIKLQRGAALPQAPLPLSAAPGVLPKVERPKDAPEIVSPMVGTFYRASAPEVPPFVEVGQNVKNEDVVCIIEAMKVMNEITSDVEGEIVEILVEDGHPVEFGQPLFKVRIFPEEKF